MMNTLKQTLAAVSLATLSMATLCTAIPSLSQAQAVAKPVADYTVFVDPPTGFVFVKMPSRWTFVGKLTQPEIDKLPATVVTALFSSESPERQAQVLPQMAEQASR